MEDAENLQNFLKTTIKTIALNLVIGTYFYLNLTILINPSIFIWGQICVSMQICVCQPSDQMEY